MSLPPLGEGVSDMQSPHIQYITVRPTVHRQCATPVKRIEPVTPVHEEVMEPELNIDPDHWPRRVADIMCTRVLTVRPELPVHQLVRLFKREHVSGFPVIDQEETLLGLVSQADVIAKVHSKPTQEASFYQTLFMPSHIDTEVPEDLVVADIMTPYVYYATEDASMAEVLDLMLDKGIHRVVVTRQGQLVGLVSTIDMLREYRRTLDSH